MASELKKVSSSCYEVKVEVKGDELKKASDKALKKLVANVTVKGFRKGQAPLELAKSRINPMDLINETINQSVNPAYQEVLKEHKLVPNFQPEVDCTDYKNESITLKFTIYTVPSCKLGEYKNIEIPLEASKVSEEEINKALEQALKDNAELVLKDGAAEMGDTVVFDFKGYVDGKEFEGGSAENYQLVLGSNQFVPGFEEQLVGVTSESKKDVEITFPEQYIKDLAGKKAKFVCMIHEIKAKKEPELNDEFVQSLGLEGITTVDQYKEHKKSDLLKAKENDAKNKQFAKLMEKIVNGSEFEISDKLIEAEAEGERKQTIAQIEQNGLTFEMYKEITGLNEEQFNKNLKEGALNRIKEYCVLNEIGQVEHLTITKDDIEAYYADVASKYGMKVEDVKKALGSNESGLANNLYQNKIERFIILNNLGNNKEDSKKETKKDSAEKVEKKETKKPATKKSK